MKTSKNSADIADLWRVVDVTPEWIPTWINAKVGNLWRSYGASDAQLHIGDERLFVEVRRDASRFVLSFAVLFLPTLLGAIFYFVTDSQLRITMICLSAICGLASFGLIYGLIRRHEGLGNYLEVDHITNSIRLPRHGLEFPFDRVVGFQWICGPTESDRTITNVDLNLLVRDAESTLRYHIMGNPSREVAETIVRFSGVALDEINLGWGGDRDRDATRK